MSTAPPLLGSPALERYGYPEFKTFTSPAAGADFSYSVPGDFYVRLLAVYCKFVADANVASREVVLSYEDSGGNRYDLMGANTTITAGNTGYYSFSAFQSYATATVDSSVLVPIHPVILSPTQVFKLHVVSVQAADALTQIRAIWERFYTTFGPERSGPHSGL